MYEGDKIMSILLANCLQLNNCIKGPIVVINSCYGMGESYSIARAILMVCTALNFGEKCYVSERCFQLEISKCVIMRIF